MKYVQDLYSENIIIAKRNVNTPKPVKRRTMFMNWKIKYHEVYSPRIGP